MLWKINTTKIDMLVVQNYLCNYAKYLIGNNFPRIINHAHKIKHYSRLLETVWKSSNDKVKQCDLWLTAKNASDALRNENREIQSKHLHLYDRCYRWDGHCMRWNWPVFIQSRPRARTAFAREAFWRVPAVPFYEKNKEKLTRSCAGCWFSRAFILKVFLTVVISVVSVWTSGWFC